MRWPRAARPSQKNSARNISTPLSPRQRRCVPHCLGESVHLVHWAPLSCGAWPSTPDDTPPPVACHIFRRLETLPAGPSLAPQTKTITAVSFLDGRKCLFSFGLDGGPPADRTRDTLIKSQVLCPFENTEKHRPDRGVGLYSLLYLIHNLLEDERTHTQTKHGDSAKRRRLAPQWPLRKLNQCRH